MAGLAEHGDITHRRLVLGPSNRLTRLMSLLSHRLTRETFTTATWRRGRANTLTTMLIAMIAMRKLPLDWRCCRWRMRKRKLKQIVCKNVHDDRRMILSLVPTEPTRQEENLRCTRTTMGIFMLNMMIHTPDKDMMNHTTMFPNTQMLVMTDLLLLRGRSEAPISLPMSMGSTLMTMSTIPCQTNLPIHSTRCLAMLGWMLVVLAACRNPVPLPAA